MTFFVNDNCIACGLCNSLCPEVFLMEDGHAAAIDGPVPEAYEDAALEAKRSCPADAIEQH